MRNVIKTTIYHSPFGELILGSYEDKLCLCDWVKGKRRANLDRRIQEKLNADFQDGSSAIIEKTKRELEKYFAGELRHFSIPVIFAGTEFQCRVWEELIRIPYGETISYAEHAKRIGSPNAVRAVASAIAMNPISIFVPCHRVIGSNRKLTGYNGGLQTKQALITLENL